MPISRKWMYLPLIAASMYGRTHCTAPDSTRKVLEANKYDVLSVDKTSTENLTHFNLFNTNFEAVAPSGDTVQGLIQSHGPYVFSAEQREKNYTLIPYR